MNTANQSTPVAQGDLAKTPFAHLVLYVYQHGLSGTLVITHAGLETHVLFRAGRAVAARPLPGGADLPGGLLELCALSEGPYVFWNADLIGEGPDVVQGTVDPFTFVAESLRAHAREEVISAIVDRYRGVRLMLVASADVGRLGVRGPDVRKAERLRSSPLTAEEFAAEAGMTADDARKLVYLLLVTGLAAPEHGGASHRSGVRSAVAGPSASSPLPQASRVPAAVPSAPPASTPANPRSASVTPSVRPAVTTPRPGPGNSIPAWQQLASMRAASRSSAPPRVPTPSMAPLPLEALDDAGKARRAEQFLERNQVADAARIAEELVAKNPRNADYQALRAATLLPSFTSGRIPAPLLDAIDAALRSEPEHAGALYVKGLVFRRLGRENEALRCFVRAVNADPHHIEAQRELRLARMRREK